MLVYQANITEYEALVQYFQQGLQPQILQAIYWRENMPRDMEGWYQAARQIDQGLEQMKNAQAGYYTTSRNNQPAIGNHDSDKMDVDRIGIKCLTTQERERYFKER